MSKQAITEVGVVSSGRYKDFSLNVLDILTCGISPPGFLILDISGYKSVCWCSLSQGGDCDVALLFLRVIPGLGGRSEREVAQSEHRDGQAGRPSGSWPETMFQVSGSLAAVIRSKVSSGRLALLAHGCGLEA